MEKRPKTIQFDTVLMLFFGAVALVLGLKYLKQYLSLMFTLLTLKFVWILLFVLFVLTAIRKKK